jgi:putative transposase
MPNHFHLLLGPREHGDLWQFLRWRTVTHTQRWHAHHRATGTGHLDQRRFQSFPVQSDKHFLTVCRSVERTAVRANWVQRAEDWNWAASGRDVRRMTRTGRC